MLVAVVLLCATVGVALVVYFYISKSEKSSFEQDFAEFSGKVMEAIGTSLEKKFGAMDTLGLAIASHALANNLTFPNVTVPDFGVKTAKVLGLTNNLLITWSPLVTTETRLGWEAYSIEHGKGWVDETLAVMETDANYYGPVIKEYDVQRVVHGNDGDIPYNLT